MEKINLKDQIDDYLRYSQVERGLSDNTINAYRQDLEEVIPASTQEVETKETSKLPITGDSIVLFVVLAALVIIAIVVFIRMKKLNKKADK